MKTCTKCFKRQDDSEFFKKCYYCKSCMREYQRAYSKAHAKPKVYKEVKNVVWPKPAYMSPAEHEAGRKRFVAWLKKI